MTINFNKFLSISTNFNKPACIILIHIFIFFFPSCQKDQSVNFNSIDYGYFPDRVGSWMIYNVVEIHIDSESGVFDTAYYQIKEIIESKFLDNSNRQTLRIERYIRENDTLTWNIKDVWFANLLTNSAQKVEENIRYVKLVFPVKLNKTWDGNAHNTLEECEYKITEIDINDTINSLFFDSVLTVTQKDEENMIEKFYFIEKYAKNTGMVYKQIIDITSLYPIPGDFEERIKLGNILTMEVVEFGFN